MVDGVFRANTRVIGWIDREFRIEYHVGPVCLVVEFHIADHRHTRKYIGQIEHFAPTLMADHDVRREAKPLQPPRGMGHDLRPTYPHTKLSRRDMSLLRG